MTEGPRQELGAMIVKVERNPKGPRLFVFGQRIHECHLGLALLAVVLIGWLAAVWSLSVWSGVALLVAGWMVAKDWRDLVPSLRDTGAWRLGVHRPFAPLRALRYADGLPMLAGSVAFAVGVVNLVSALTPNIAWRHHVLLQLEPVRLVPLFHTLAVPLSVGLIVTSFYLRARRRRAAEIACLLLVVLGALNLLKGLDVEEAALSWGCAALLWWGRDSFAVQHQPLARRSFPLAVVGAIGVVLVAGGLVWLASGRSASPAVAVRSTLDLFTWTRSSVAFHDELAWVPLAVAACSLTAIVLGAYLFFRPLPAPRPLPDAAEREAAYELVRAYGTDTLAFFKLRRDLHYLFSADRRAFLGYRVAGRVLLVAGDPVGPPDALPALIRQTTSFAEERGLALAAVGASRSLLPLWRQAGLRSLYLGDEVILDTAGFSLDGRAIRKVRQSVTRMEKAGYSASAVELSSIDADTHAELERVSQLWRAGAPERGFSMALDSLEAEPGAGSVVILARDRSGAVRGFLHFVPSFGRPAMSLSFMRRERNTPNGLTEFLVVKAVELLRERGVEELSLNFAAFGRLLERPRGRLEQWLGRLVALGDRYFQIESLYRFSAKFSPRWEPRYLVYEGVLGLPRAGLAAAAAEGQVPRIFGASPRTSSRAAAESARRSRLPSRQRVR
jgi:lysyl-tRNA synthetase, class II